jgi:hypothetical protein
VKDPADLSPNSKAFTEKTKTFAKMKDAHRDEHTKKLKKIN